MSDTKYESAHRMTTRFLVRQHGAAIDLAFVEKTFVELDDLRAELAALQAHVAEAERQEPVAWCVAYDDQNCGRIHSDPTMCKPEAERVIANAGSPLVLVELYTRPVPAAVLDGWVMVPKEISPQMIKAFFDEFYKHKEAFSLSNCYADMLAAAQEGNKP